MLGCYVGIVVGDALLWLLGHALGRRALTLPVIRQVATPAKLAHAEDWFRRYGVVVVLISRMLPGSRFPTYLAAGMLGAKARSFLLAALIAALLWTPALVWLSAHFGRQLGLVFGGMEQHPWMTLAGSILVIAVALHALMLVGSRRQRLLFRARWARRARWEFWPLWLFQAPVLLWSLLLAVRHRGLRLPLLVNPGIPLGGFVGESKHAILEGMRQGDDCLVRSLLLPRALALPERLTRTEAWRLETGVAYPLIVKPDVGQRGSGLRKVDGPDGLAAALDAPYALLVQEYIDLPLEFGVSWIQEPGRSQGRITGITGKQFPVVTGDGRSTTEELVLRHPRQRLWADRFLRRLGHKELAIPAEGQPVRLAEAGNHVQGTTFRDLSHLATAELAARLQELVRDFPGGFHLGRFDLRTAHEEDLQHGRNLRLIELNGVSGEPTHIYDPERGLLAAWRDACAHWSAAFLIGATLRRQGLRPPPYRAFLRAAWRSWRESRQHPLAD